MICKFMGWSYFDLLGLPVDVYGELLELIKDTTRDDDAEEDLALPLPERTP